MPGVGIRRRKALLTAFGSLAGVRRATREELAAVPHHLIDIIDPLDSYSVAQFRKDTLRLAEEINARGKLPLLVGGTMLYVRALQSGLAPLPPEGPHHAHPADHRGMGHRRRHRRSVLGAGARPCRHAGARGSGQRDPPSSL